LNMSSAGVYTFNSKTILVNDVNAGNDATPSVNRTKVSLSAGTAAGPSGFCAPSPTSLSLSASATTGATSLQWLESTSLNGTYANIGGATTVPFTLPSAPAQTMYYKLVAGCGTAKDTSNAIMVEYFNPQVTATTPATRCGPGTVTLQATTSAGTQVKWYAAPTGGTSLATGNSYTTPAISANTTYYVSAAASGGGSGSTPMPAHASNLAGNVRGYWFTAPVNFRITGVQVPGTTASPQNVAIVRFDAGVTPPTYSSTTNAFTVLFLSQNDPSTGVIPVSIQVNANDVIGVLGQVGTGTTANTSYGNGNPFTTTIDGQNVSLNRLGMQFPLTTNAPQSLWQEPTSTTIGRIELTYETGCESARTGVIARTDDCAVPVTLLSFKGERQGSFNKLEWTTSSEVNNSGFELQRSADGQSFSKIAFIESKSANGNSTTTLSYSFNDLKPLLGSGFYRLRQLDKDGRYTYSNVVLLKGARTTELLLVNVYPNPANNLLNALVTAPAAGEVSIIMTDLSGKAVLKQKAWLSAGDNRIQLPVTALASGSYLIKLTCVAGCETGVTKFVKQ